MIPPDDYRPAPGWYRHHDVLRWHDGHRWTDRTKPLPDARHRRHSATTSLAVVAGVLTLTAAAVVLGIWQVIS